MMAYTQGRKHVVAYYILLLIIYNCCVLWLYVCIEIYTLQLYIIDLTQRGCHTLRLGTLTSWNPLGHSRPVTGFLYHFCQRLSRHQCHNAAWRILNKIPMTPHGIELEMFRLVVSCLNPLHHRTLSVRTQIWPPVWNRTRRNSSASFNLPRKKLGLKRIIYKICNIHRASEICWCKHQETYAEFTPLKTPSLAIHFNLRKTSK